MFPPTIIGVICVVVCSLHVRGESVRWKLCCDEMCKEPISHAQTIVRNLKRESGYLAYPANAKVTVYAKSVHGDNNVWEAEMHGRRGLISASTVRESSVYCKTPQHWVEVHPGSSAHSPNAEKPDPEITPSIEEDPNTPPSADLYRGVSAESNIPASLDSISEPLLHGREHSPEETNLAPSEDTRGTEYDGKEEQGESHSQSQLGDELGSRELDSGSQSRPQSHDGPALPPPDNSNLSEQLEEDKPFDEELNKEDRYDNEDDEGEREGDTEDESDEEENGSEEDDIGIDRSDLRQDDEEEGLLYDEMADNFLQGDNVPDAKTESQYNSESQPNSPRTGEMDSGHERPGIVDPQHESGSVNVESNDRVHTSETQTSNSFDVNAETDDSHSGNFIPPNETKSGFFTGSEAETAGDPDSASEDSRQSQYSPDDSHTNASPPELVPGSPHPSTNNPDLAPLNNEETPQIITSTPELAPDTPRSSTDNPDLAPLNDEETPQAVSSSITSDIMNQDYSVEQTEKQDLPESHSDSLSNTDVISDTTASILFSTLISNHSQPSTDSTLINTSVPETNIPSTHVPEPNLNNPESNVPETNIPSTRVPDPEISNINDHKSNIPETNIPSTHIPDPETSNSNDPKSSVPDTSDPSPFHSGESLSYLASRMSEKSRSSSVTINTHLPHPDSLHDRIKHHHNEPSLQEIPVKEKEVYLPNSDREEVKEQEDHPWTKKKYILDSLVENCASLLPPSFEEWVLSLGPDAGLIAIVTTAVAMILPLCCLCCRTQRNASKISRQLKAELSRKMNSDAYIKNLKSEKEKLEKKVESVETDLRSVQEQLDTEKQGNWDLENARGTLELEKNALSQELFTLQQEHNQVQQNSKKLTNELQQTMSQLSAVLEEKAHALLQVTELNSQLEKAVLDSQELEAAKLQLEQDCYNLRNSLVELQQEHAEATDEKAALSTRSQELDTELQSSKEERDALQKTVEEKETELEALRGCVQQLTQAEENEERDSVSQLEIVKSLLDTTKVRVELNEVTQDRDLLRQQLQDQESVLDQIKSENESLQAQLSSLTSSKEALRQEFNETEMKLKAITEYFERKETQLHRKIGEEEMIRQRVESREAYAKERAESAESEREKEREELKELRKQMGDIEKSLMQQVVTNEKRAEETLSQLRRTEQELRAAHKEVTVLKRRLEENRRSPSPPPMRPLPPPEMRRSPVGPLPQRFPPPYGPGYGPPPPHGPPPPRGPPPSFRGPPGPRQPLLPPRTSSPVEDTDRPRGEGSLPPRPRSAINEGHHGYHGEDIPHNSRQTPPGMESHDHYRPRPDYPLSVPPRDYPRHYGEGPRHPLPPVRPLSRPNLSNSVDESHEDRPPVPGNHDYPSSLSRPYPTRDPYYRPPPPPDRRRPPSGPQYGELSRSFDRTRAPSNPRDYPFPLNQSGPLPRVMPTGPHGPTAQSLPSNANQDAPSGTHHLGPANSAPPQINNV